MNATCRLPMPVDEAALSCCNTTYYDDLTTSIICNDPVNGDTLNSCISKTNTTNAVCTIPESSSAIVRKRSSMILILVSALLFFGRLTAAQPAFSNQYDCDGDSTDPDCNVQSYDDWENRQICYGTATSGLNCVGNAYGPPWKCKSISKSWTKVSDYKQLGSPADCNIGTESIAFGLTDSVSVSWSFGGDLGLSFGNLLTGAAGVSASYSESESVGATQTNTVGCNDETERVCYWGGIRYTQYEWFERECQSGGTLCSDGLRLDAEDCGEWAYLGVTQLAISDDLFTAWDFKSGQDDQCCTPGGEGCDTYSASAIRGNARKVHWSNRTISR